MERNFSFVNFWIMIIKRYKGLFEKASRSGVNPYVLELLYYYYFFILRKLNQFGVQFSIGFPVLRIKH